MSDKNKKNVLKSGEFVVHRKKRGTISEFFNHLMVYGGISYGRGVLKVWGDTSLFVPIDALTVYYNLLKKSIKKEADDIFYWLGHLYGKNCTLMLMKKFGFNKKKVSDFVNGATQDGFGFMDVVEIKYSKNSFYGKVEGTNSHFALNYKKMFGKQKSPVDFYMCGILGGGSEPLFGMNIEVNEKKCMSRGDKECIYILEDMKNPKKFKFFEKVKLNEKEIRKKTEMLGRKRKIKFSLMKKPNIHFGDGSFMLNGFQGFNLASYELVLLDFFTYKLVGEKKFNNIRGEVSKKYINGTFNKKYVSNNFSSKTIDLLFRNVLESFGFGSLTVKSFGKKKIIIQNENNPYFLDYVSLFKKKDAFAMEMPARLIKDAFKKYFNKNVKISSLKCTPNKCFIELALN